MVGSNALVWIGHCSGMRVRGGGAQGAARKPRLGLPASGALLSLNQLLEADNGLFISVRKT